MKNKRTQVCWGIFMRKNPNFNGTHRTPLVYCDTEETAKKIIHDVDFIHYNSKYKQKDCVIKKITKEVDIPEWQR